MKHYVINGYKRVSKSEARKLYDDGKTICVVPCYIRPKNQQGMYAMINKYDEDTNFDDIINAYEIYNCINKAVGTYAAFYILA